MYSERLTDEETNWGPTRIQFAQAEKQRLREREKKRRQRAEQARRANTLAVIEPDYLDVFMTASGILAYRQWVPNRTALGSAPMTAKGEGFYVSLPLVSIQQS